MQRGYQYVRGSRLMRWISISAILFSILFFSIALPFSRAATEQYVHEESLASFLGLFNGLSTAAAFLASLFLANRLFARFGIMACILVLPMIYLIGFGTLVFVSTFIIIVAFRFIQMLWLSGIADPAWQTMLNVIPPERRDQVRAFIGGVPEQAGTFIAGTILIIGEQTLAPQQLYIIGLFTAALCTYVIHQARRGYNDALLDALRAGRANLFFTEEQPFGGFLKDASAIKAALDGLRDPDPTIRRISAEIIGHLSLTEATELLLDGLHDSDSLVRASCLRALAGSRATSALPEVIASLRDPEPDVRFAAVSALSALNGNPSNVVNHLAPMLDDPDSRVSTRAAVSILQLPSPKRREGGGEVEKAKIFLRRTSVLGDISAREHALTALGDWKDVEAFDFLVNELGDPGLPVVIRRVILMSIFRIDDQKALPYLIDALGEADSSLRETVASLLGQIGRSALDPVIFALQDPVREEGALVALQKLPLPPSKPIEDFARAAVTRAVEYDALMRGIKSTVQNEAMNLLAESLHHKSHKYGIHSLQAIGLLGNRDTMNLAIENFQSPSTTQNANVIEALDSIGAKWRAIIQPLMRLWENESSPGAKVDWKRLLADSDEWIRDCTLFAAHKLGEMKMDNIATLSLMERILFFKRVPLFANLSPTDLKQVAAIAQEELFSDGDTIVHEGEVGDVMFIIVSGEIRVIAVKGDQEVELARRKPGQFVGEMALITREPRIATLTAVGDVRTLCIDQKSFEALLHDRPDVSMAVIQVLSQRLKEISRSYS
jgi:CRP/FNR family transcriptional regulator